MVKVTWTQQAIKDLNVLAEYIAKDPRSYAELTVERLFYSVEILETHRKAGNKVPEFNDNSLRQIIVGNY